MAERISRRGARAHKSRMSIIYIYRRGPMSICFHPSRPRPLIPRRPNARIPFSANEHPPTASTITIVFSSSPWNTSAPPRSPSLPSLPPFRSIRARATPVSIGHARDLEPTRYLQRVIIRDEKFVIVPDDFSVPSPLPPPDFFSLSSPLE